MESGERSHLFNFTGISANKAGMGADRKMVADFVYEKSKNSQYTQHQLDLDAKQQQRTAVVAEELRQRERRMTEAERDMELRRAEQQLFEFEKHRELSRTHCVADMDMFYAAVEIRDEPSLALKPVAIGGLGMICTANYVARLYGVRAAMPGFIAVEMVRHPELVGSKMPPEELIFIQPNFSKYTTVAMQTREIFRRYDPNFRAYSLDEAYLDLTNFLRSSQRDADAVVKELRDEVKATTGLSCSAGIGPNRMVAKIASDEKKPDGQTRIPNDREEVLAFMDRLPVRKIPGCGKVLEHQITSMLGVSNCRELRLNAWRCRSAFASRPKTCSFLLRAALGISGEELSEEGDEVGAVNRKSLSCERTFRAEDQAPELRTRLRELCRQVAEDMAASVPPLAGRTATLKLKTSNFEVRNKQVWSPRLVGFQATFAGADCEASVAKVSDEIYRLLEPVLEEFLPAKLRLMGVRISGFRDQKTVLCKGQKQLQRFFAKAEAEADTSAVIDVESEEEATGSLKRVAIDAPPHSKRPRDHVTCPVCGIAVPVSQADSHVNAHYDA